MKCPYNGGGDCSECWREICPVDVENELRDGLRAGLQAAKEEAAIEEIVKIIASRRR